MNYKKLIFILLNVLLFLTINPNFIIKGEQVLEVGNNGYTFTSIQKAIQQANSGDTIIVHNGTYSESIDLYKKINLIGEAGITILEGNGDKDIVTISADECMISGFIIRNCSNDSYSGLNIKSDYNIIQENIIENNSGCGIYLFYSNGNEIVNNTFINDGICIIGKKTDWNSHIISFNTMNSKPILFYKDKKDFLVANFTAGQIILANCSGCKINNNNVSGGDHGIVLGYSHNNTVINNKALKSRLGIRMQYSDNNIIKENHIDYNDYGVYITHSFNNEIYKNNIKNNRLYGCWICCNSKNNIIFMNNFTSNNHSAYDFLMNNWSKDGVGNYWSDYDGIDTNNDGIGESPYMILPEYGSNKDLYPIVDYYKLKYDDNFEDVYGFEILITFIAIIILLISRKKMI